MRRLMKFALPAALTALAACSPASDSATDAESYVEVPEGKEDNYFSTVAQEYDLSGIDVVRVEERYTGSDATKRARQLSLARVKAVAWFTGQAIDNAKADYSSLRHASTSVQPVESGAYGSWTFPFHLELASSKTLLSKDWIRVGEDSLYFTLDLPALSNEELLSGSYTTTYAKFDPSLLPEGSRDTLRVDIAASKTSVDAYPEYKAMFADKSFDIDVYVGWDSSGDYRKVTSALFEGLKGIAAGGNELKAVSDLRKDSSFLRLLANPAGLVETHIRLIHPDLKGVDGGDLADLWRASVATRDVVVYVGWAGESAYASVKLHEDYDGNVPVTEFPSLKLSSKKQLFVFNGSDSYGLFADALFANPAKADLTNLDVLTAANWVSDSRAADTTMALLQGLTARNNRGHVPQSFGTIMTSMSAGRSAYAVYGVHGIDDNPHQSPWADVAEVGKQCIASSSCTGPDTLCVRTAGASCSVCAPSCFDDTSCTGGTRCRPIYDSNNSTVVGKQCLTVAPVCR